MPPLWSHASGQGGPVGRSKLWPRGHGVSGWVALVQIDCLARPICCPRHTLGASLPPRDCRRDLGFVFLALAPSSDPAQLGLKCQVILAAHCGHLSLCVQRDPGISPSAALSSSSSVLRQPVGQRSGGRDGEGKVRNHVLSHQQDSRALHSSFQKPR